MRESIVGHKFLGTLAQKAAEDAYPPLKTAFLRLIARTSGPAREIEPKIVSSPGKAIPSGPVSAFSVIYRSENGLWRRFIFPARIPDVEQRIALETLLQLAEELDAKENPDSKSRGIELVFDTQARRWAEVDTMAEARRLQAKQNERRNKEQSQLPPNQAGGDGPASPAAHPQQRYADQAKDAR